MINNLQIEEALAAQVESAAKARGISTREFIKSALQDAVASSGPKVKVTPFSQRVHDFGTHIESPWTILVDFQSEEYLRKYSRK